MKVKTEEKTGIFILNDAAWQTDRHSFSTKSVPGFEDSSDLDLGAHQQLKTHVNKYSRARLAPQKLHINSFRMCMAYSTMNEVAHTECCYYYQNRGERRSAQLQYLYGREPRQLSRKEARFLHPHRAKPVQRLWLSHKVSLDRAAALCLNSVNGLRFPYI